MDKPSVPMTQQLIKRTRGNMSEEQRLESHLMRKAAKLHKQALPDRTLCAEDQVDMPVGVNWIAQNCNRSCLQDGTSLGPVSASPPVHSTSLPFLTVSPFSSLVAPDLPPAAVQRSAGKQAFGRFGGSEERMRNPEKGQGLAKHDGQVADRSHAASAEVQIQAEGSLGNVSDDVEGPLAGCLSSLSIGWLEKEAAALLENVSPEPQPETEPEAVHQCLSFFSALINVIQENNKGLHALNMTPSLDFLSTLPSTNAAAIPVATAQSEVDNMNQHQHGHVPHLTWNCPSAAGAPALSSPGAGEPILPAAETGAVTDMSDSFSGPTIMSLPKKVKVFGSESKYGASFFDSEARNLLDNACGSMRMASGSDVSMNIITPVDMPLRMNSQGLPSGAFSSNTSSSQTFDKPSGWYITPEGNVSAVHAAPVVAWGARPGPTPGVVYSALGRKRGRPRKKPVPVAPAPPPTPMAGLAGSLLPPAPGYRPIHCLGPSGASGKPSRAVSMPQAHVQRQASHVLGSLRASSLPTIGPHPDVWHLLATLSSSSSFMSSLGDGQYVGSFPSPLWQQASTLSNFRQSSVNQPQGDAFNVPTD
eukprot:jgi/Botrbrau1/7260/Bobra.0021s0040.2